jgi:hypothetical protein
MNTVLEAAIALALNEALTEGRLRGLGVMISHMLHGSRLQCLFEGGVINKTLGSHDQPTKEHNT